jgi:polynucleotide 5'-kinase involved in rRNA processing
VISERVTLRRCAVGAVGRGASDEESVEDRLDITPDVHTVDALATAVSTEPPLSIALLGDWGTGKSTFMRQMSDRIQQLADLSHNNPGLSLFAANTSGRSASTPGTTAMPRSGSV